MDFLDLSKFKTKKNKENLHQLEYSRILTINIRVNVLRITMSMKKDQKEVKITISPLL
jgi:hypothetical protein